MSLRTLKRKVKMENQGNGRGKEGPSQNVRTVASQLGEKAPQLIAEVRVRLFNNGDLECSGSTDKIQLIGMLELAKISAALGQPERKHENKIIIANQNINLKGLH